MEHEAIRTSGYPQTQKRSFSGPVLPIGVNRQIKHRNSRELDGVVLHFSRCIRPAEIPLLPDDYRPLVRALVEENNELLMRVQQRARQNHVLLSRSVDLMQRFIATLIPSEKLTRYNEAGTVSTPGLPHRTMYEAVG